MGDPKQVNQNIDAKKQNTYDAIVVGSGISGGLAAKELCEKDLKHWCWKEVEMLNILKTTQLRVCIPGSLKIAIKLYAAGKN